MTNWLDIEPNKVNNFGEEQTRLNHRFSESGLFDDNNIARLIENYPRAHYNVTTMNRSGQNTYWRDGDFGELSGHQVLEAIRNGHLWLNLRRLEDNAPEIGKLVSQAMAEIAAAKPGYNTFRQNTGLLISSPGAKVHCHADIPMIALWHLRGRKRIWVWDAEDKILLPDEALEAIILREQEEDTIDYRPELDQKATCYDLEPGDMLSWPLNAPHRVDNLDGLNMSLTTEYFTSQAQRKYGVYYANGMMRRKLGIEPRSTSTNGAQALAKCAMAFAAKKLNVSSAETFEFVASFVVDPSAPDGVRFLAEHERKTISLA